MLLSEVLFGSFLAYSPRGEDESSRTSQRWVRNLKSERLVGDPPVPTSELVATRLQQRLHETPLGDLLTPDALLVPVPSSTLLRPGGLWVPFLLAQALVRAGLGRGVEACLERRVALRKAATSSASDRPLASEHYGSIAVRTLAFPPQKIVVVDDVITRGATMLAAVSKLQEAIPNAHVRGFAAVRTISEPTGFHGMFDPVVGRVTLEQNQRTSRRP